MGQDFLDILSRRRGTLGTPHSFKSFVLCILEVVTHYIILVMFSYLRIYNFVNVYLLYINNGTYI